MVFGHHTRGAIVQILTYISPDVAQIFVYKHAGLHVGVSSFLEVLANASPETLRAMVTELLVSNKFLRGAAPIKHVFESGIDDLERWALHDGWAVEDDTLVRITPEAEEATGVRDKFLEDLTVSGLDEDRAIKAAVENSSKDFVAEPPDFNGSTTKVRIALETVARRAAGDLAAKGRGSYKKDSWGNAISFLRAEDVIDKQEEEILARIYTFTSPGAHVPKGVTEEEWARLARTFGLSSAYFLLRKYVAA